MPRAAWDPSHSLGQSDPPLARRHRTRTGETADYLSFQGLESSGRHRTLPHGEPGAAAGVGWHGIFFIGQPPLPDPVTGKRPGDAFS